MKLIKEILRGHKQNKTQLLEVKAEIENHLKVSNDINFTQLKKAISDVVNSNINADTTQYYALYIVVCIFLVFKKELEEICETGASRFKGETLGNCGPLYRLRYLYKESETLIKLCNVVNESEINDTAVDTVVRLLLSEDIQVK